MPKVNKKKPVKNGGSKRGRPADPSLPRQQFWMRMSDDERTRWTAAADVLGLDLSTWIRMTCNRAVQP